MIKAFIVIKWDILAKTWDFSILSYLSQSHIPAFLEKKNSQNLNNQKNHLWRAKIAANSNRNKSDNMLFRLKISFNTINPIEMAKTQNIY